MIIGNAITATWVRIYKICCQLVLALIEQSIRSILFVKQCEKLLEAVPRVHESIIHNLVLSVALVPCKFVIGILKLLCIEKFARGQFYKIY